MWGYYFINTKRINKNENNKMIIKFFIWMLILAYFHARQEGEIEGKAGWARHLPTFRISTFITKLLLNKEITGYHIFLLLMFLYILVLL